MDVQHLAYILGHEPRVVKVIGMENKKPLRVIPQGLSLASS